MLRIDDNRPEWGKGCSRACLIPIRVIIALLILFGFVAAYVCRVSIGHVMTVIVFPPHSTNDTKSEKNEVVCPKEQEDSKHSFHSEPEYDWSSDQQGFILGCFYIGYLISHLPGGIVADKYGAKWVLLMCLASSAITTMASPLALKIGDSTGLIAMRILMGLAQGLLFPAVASLLSAWIPAKERGSLGTFAFSGVTVGTVSSNIGCGLLLHSFHWPVTLYVFGGFAILWCIVFGLLSTSTPQQHKCINPSEVEYLTELIQPKEKFTIPWKAMLLNMQTFALIVCQIGHDWGYYVMISCLPKYMADVLQFSIRSNGLYTSLPFMAMFFSSILNGFIADFLIRRGILQIQFERKLFTFLGAFLPSGLMVAASYAGCNKQLVVACFTLSLFTMGPYYAGQKLTVLDMAPTFSGILMAVSNGMGSIAGISSPMIVGLLAPNSSLNEWRLVFWLGFLIMNLTAIIFCIWGTAYVQPYDPIAYKGP